MGLSNREILLVLRARDEATRTIGRVSSAMSRMDRNAITQAARTRDAMQGNLVGMRRHVHDVEYAYRQQTLAARQARIDGKLTSKQFQQSMLQAQRLRVDQLEQLRQVRQRQEDLITSQRHAIAQQKEAREAARAHGRALVANGSAAIAAGASMTYFSARGVEAYMSNISAAMEYETQVRRTFTQVDKGRASLQQLSRLGKSVADNIAVPMEQIQPALYDIFSSIDVGFRGASKMVKQFSRDAVGGSTDLQTATRANLLIMNAYGIKAKNVSKISDFMFQLVRKGVGTYDEFAKTIGRAIPSATRLGVSYRTLGGMLAFMTRQGLSTAMASTSAARAMDALANPKTVENLKKMGVNITDIHGNFKPLPKILGDMNQKMKGMNKLQRSEFLKKAFLGSGGTIQAMRFFNQAFRNFGEFKKRLKEMRHDTGAAEQAYNKMAESPQAKLQALKNDFKLLAIEIGEDLLPIAMKVVDWADKLHDKWQKLDPDTRKLITRFVGVSLVVGTLIGVLTMVGGAFMVVAGAAEAIGATLGGMIGVMTGAVGIIGILAAIGYQLYKHWDQVAPALQRFRDAVSEHIGAAYDWLKGTFGPGIKKMLGEVKKAWRDFRDDVSEAWDQLKENLDIESMKDDLKSLREEVERNKANITAALQGLGMAIRIWAKIWGTELQLMAILFGSVFNGIIRGAAEFVHGIIQIFGGLAQMMQGTLKVFRSLLTGDWRGLWKGLQQIARGGIDVIVGLFRVLIGAPYRVVAQFVKGIIKQFQHLFDVLVGHSIVPDLIDAIVKAFASLPGRVLGNIAGFVSNIIAEFGRMYSSVTKKVSEMVDKAVNTIKGIRTRASGAVGSLAGLLVSKGASLVEGFIAGIRSRWSTLQSWISKVKNAAGAASGLGHDHSAYEAPGPIGDLPPGYSSKAAVAGGMLERVAGKGRGGRHRPRGFDALNVKKMSKNFKLVWTQLLKDMGTEKPKIGKLMDDMRRMIDHKFKKLNKKQKAHMLASFRKSVEGEIKRLDRVAEHYRKVLKKLEKAQDRLRNLKEARRNYIDSVKSSIKDFGSLGSLTQPEDVFGNQEDWTVANITSQLRDRLATIKEFGKNLKKLLQMGFSKNVYNQVIQMGPEAGSVFAAALVQATPQEVAQINSLASQVSTQANSIATTAGNEMYNAGIKAAQAIVDGLKSKAKDLEEIAIHLGHLIARAIKRALKIKSPSKVGLAIGKNFGSSLASGLHGQRHTVTKAAQALANAAAFDPSMVHSSSNLPVVGGMGGAGFAGSGGKSVTVKQDITVNTQEIDPRRHAAQLGWELASRYRI